MMNLALILILLLSTAACSGVKPTPKREDDRGIVNSPVLDFLDQGL